MKRVQQDGPDSDDVIMEFIFEINNEDLGLTLKCYYFKMLFLKNDSC